MNKEILTKRLDSVLGREGVKDSTVEYVNQWIQKSSPIERNQINPIPIVNEEHSLSDILPVFLHGVHTEAFALNWQTHCPHCNMVADSYATLKEAKSLSNCSMCEKEYIPDFQDRIEVSFSLNKDIEDLELPSFCTPPAQLKTLVALQLEQGDKKEAEITIEPGEYRFFCPITGSKGILHVSGFPTDELQELEIIQEPQKFNISEVRVQPGKLKVIGSNPSVPVAGLFLHENILLEEIPYSLLPARLTGTIIQHFPLFTKLFGQEVLSDRERLMISSITVLFTDITASTRMYEALGDVTAYNIVRDHFDILSEEIQNCEGIIIKTIGDSIMASFKSNSDAMKAIFQAKEKMKLYNEKKDLIQQVHLKIGIHRGPAILVNLNDRLDYFGSTINKAARIQSLSNSGEVSFSEEIFSDPKIKPILKSQGIKKLTKTQKNLKGLDGFHSIYQFSWN